MCRSHPVTPVVDVSRASHLLPKCLVFGFGVGFCFLFSHYATQRVRERPSKLYLLALPFTRRLRELIFIKNQQNRKSSCHPETNQEALISLPGRPAALWKCYWAGIAAFIACLQNNLLFSDGCQIFHAKQGRGPKAAEGGCRRRGLRGNTMGQDLDYLPTYFYNDKNFIVFCCKL